MPAEVASQLSGLKLRSRIKTGDSVAITAGSRGIDGLPRILAAVVGHLKSLGASPFIVPAMGSHGGGTAEGQRQVLAGYGVSEEAVGCPIRASMETVTVCHTPYGFPVHFDRLAYEADHVVVCNRVKPHTRFAGHIESGLMKMMLIGLGKCAGATVYHRAIEDYTFDQIVHAVAKEVIARCRIVAGLAIVENANDRTARIVAVPPEEFEARERELLVLAKGWMARLPFDEVDLLVVDRIGKEISGTGLDTNVVGRKFNDHHAVAEELPRVKLIAVRGLTEATHGNAVGLGIAEFCRSRVLAGMDVAATRLNAIVAGHVSAALRPLDYDTDREILSTALSAIGLREPGDARLLWIPDTLRLEEVECSSAYYREAEGRSDLEIVAPPRELPLDSAGNLPDDHFPRKR